MIDVIQIGKRRNYLVPVALNQIGCLHSLYTDYSSISSMKKRIVFDIFKITFQDELLKSINKEKVQNISYGLLYYLFRYFITNKQQLDKLHMKAVNSFLTNIVKDINQENSRSLIIYGYNGASLEVYENIKNKKFIFDMTSLLPLDEYNILKEEYSRFGHIENNVFSQNYETVKILHNRQLEELKYADQILCLSNDVKKSVRKYTSIDDELITIVHHPIVLGEKRKSYNTKITKIVFLGRVSIDKGIHYLLQFVDQHEMENLHIDVIGPIHIKNDILFKYKHKITFIGALSSKDVKNKLSDYDLMVFPSVVGGLGMACYEAMAQGIPVLTTENEVIVDDINGFTFLERNYDSFQKKLLKVLEYSPNKMNIVSNNAYQLMENYQLANYTTKLSTVIKKVLK